METDGYKCRERLMKKWMDCVNVDMARNGVNSKLTRDNGERKLTAPTSNKVGKRVGR